MKGKSILFAIRKEHHLPDGLSRSQKNRIRDGYQKIDDHITEKDISGAIHDIKGNPITNNNGKPYQHYKEVDEAVEALKDEKASLIKSIQNPKMIPEIKKYIQDVIQEFDLIINKWKHIKGEKNE